MASPFLGAICDAKGRFPYRLEQARGKEKQPGHGDVHDIRVCVDGIMLKHCVYSVADAHSHPSNFNWEVLQNKSQSHCDVASRFGELGH